MPRLVAAGVCTGEKLTPCPREEEEEEDAAQMTIKARVGRAGPKPERHLLGAHHSSLTQGRVTEAMCLPGKCRRAGQQEPKLCACGSNRFSLGRRARCAGPTQPCVCRPTLAWGGLGRAWQNSLLQGVGYH